MTGGNIFVYCSKWQDCAAMPVMDKVFQCREGVGLDRYGQCNAASQCQGIDQIA